MAQREEEMNSNGQMQKKKSEAREVKKRETALRQKTETCCTRPQNQRTQIQVQQKANSTNQG